MAIFTLPKHRLARLAAILLFLFITIDITPAGAQASIVINEFAPKGSEWVELYNPTGTAVDVSGWYLDDANCGSGSSILPATTTIPAGGYLVINSGDNGDNFSLSNSGDRVVLCNASDTEIDRVTYGNSGAAPIGPSASGGSQYSVARVPNGNDTNDDARDFNIDDTPTPGAANDAAAINLGSTVVINELDAYPSGGGNDMLELYNPTASPMNVGGWYISDGDDVAILNPGLSVPAGGYLIIEEDVHWTEEGSTGVDFASADVAYLFDSSRVRVDQIGWSGEFEDDCYARVPDGAGVHDGYNWSSSDGGNTWVDQACTLGATNNPSVTTTFIHNIQGNSSTQGAGGEHDDISPLNGNTVTVQGVVVADFQGATGVNDDKLDGFFLQEEDGDADADPSTSEGLFVYCGSCPTNVEEGYLVTVTGSVSEYFGMTQISATGAGDITVDDTNTAANLALVSPAIMNLPVVGDIDDYYEQFEGMLVQFSDTLTVTELYLLPRYGQLTLSEGGKLRQYTQDATLPLNATDYNNHQDNVARRQIILDDDNNVQNEDPVYHPQPGFSVSNYVRGGATISNLTGVLHWSWAGSSGTNAWRVRPTGNNPIAFNNPARPTGAPSVGGNIRVASMNVLNYFNGDGAGGGFPTSRGAHSAAELARQTDKIVSAILQIDADVVGLMEIENDPDGSNSALDDLVDALNTAAGAGTYAYVQTGATGTDEIKVAIIYKPTVVTPVGAPQVLDTAAFTDPNGLGSQKNRPAVAQTFRVSDVGNPDFGAAFTVVVVHMKSKGSSCGGGDDDTTTGQGNCNGTRTGGATALVNWLATDPTNTAGNLGAVDTDYLIIGDFNAYYQEDPMQVFYSNGYSNLVAQSSYSYVFDGEWGALDHAVASSSLNTQVTGAQDYHINSDESSLLDYNDTVQDSGEASWMAKPATNPLYNPDEFRSSDHDPVVIGLDLDASAPTPTPTATTAAPGNGNNGNGNGQSYAIGECIVLTISSSEPFVSYGQTWEWVITITNTCDDGISGVLVLNFPGLLVVNIITDNNGAIKVVYTTPTMRYGRIALPMQSDVTQVAVNLDAGESRTIRVSTTLPQDYQGTSVTATANFADVSGGASSDVAASATVLIVSELPSTGETPIWRDVILAIIGLAIVLSIGQLAYRRS